MITKSYHKPYIFYLFRDDNTEVEFQKKLGLTVRIIGDYKFSKKDKEYINKYFKKEFLYVKC